MAPESTQPSPSDLLGRRVGHIRIERFLASGGMGALYVGVDETLERQVALKAIRSGARLDPEARARFRREARALSRLRHPNICQIHDYIEGAENDFLVLELIEGRSLDEALGQGLSDALKLRVAEQLARVLAAAHEAGVVHRDLKPANVMLTSDDQVKVLDFGLSRFVERSEDAPAAVGGAVPAPFDWDDARLGQVETVRIEPAPVQLTVRGDVATQCGSVMGTLDYMSPEQARGEVAGPASDVYSLGLLLQALFTGRSAYEPGLLPTDQLAKVIRGETLSAVGLDPDLAALIGRMKALAPGARPSAVDVAERLAWIGDKPRRRLRKLATTAAVVFLALFGAVMAFQAWRISREAERANREADRARQEAAAARGVSDFLVGLFEVSDPGQARGNTVTAREILDEGSRRIENDLEAQPLTRARLMGAMGVVYMNLGLYEQALPLLQRAADIRAERLGPSDPELATSLHDLATLHHHREAYDLAAPLYRRALEIRERSLGMDHPDVGLSLNHLAALYRGIGEYDAAIPLYERALRILEKARGPDHPDVGTILNNLAAIYRLKGDYARAEPLYRRDLEIAEKTLGADHPELATSLNNLGVLYRDTGDLDRAAPLFERSLAICEKAQGADHPEVAITLANQGVLQYARGDHAGAQSRLERAAGILAKALGEDSLALAQTRVDLARVRLAQGRLPEAERLVEQSRAACERLLARNPDNSRAKGLLAAVLLERGRARSQRGDSASARADWERALLLLEALPPRIAVAVSLVGARAKALLLLGHTDEAGPVLLELMAKRWSDPDLVSLCRARGLPCRAGT
jgi:tetratricopeptide (TPR) repeat protein/predicted Ser/Thr protein kinase